MKAYRVDFTKAALKSLKKLDKPTAALILGWVRKNLEGTDDPRRHGKPLTGNHAGSWHYRVGIFRLLAEIRDEEIVIMIVGIGHRREVYR